MRNKLTSHSDTYDCYLNHSLVVEFHVPFATKSVLLMIKDGKSEDMLLHTYAGLSYKIIHTVTYKASKTESLDLCQR